MNEFKRRVAFDVATEDAAADAASRASADAAAASARSVPDEAIAHGKGTGGLFDLYEERVGAGEAKLGPRSGEKKQKNSRAKLREQKRAAWEAAPGPYRGNSWFGFDQDPSVEFGPAKKKLTDAEIDEGWTAFMNRVSEKSAKDDRAAQRAFGRNTGAPAAAPRQSAAAAAEAAEAAVPAASRAYPRTEAKGAEAAAAAAAEEAEEAEELPDVHDVYSAGDQQRMLQDRVASYQQAQELTSITERATRLTQEAAAAVAAVRDPKGASSISAPTLAEIEQQRQELAATIKKNEDEVRGNIRKMRAHKRAAERAQRLKFDKTRTEEETERHEKRRKVGIPTAAEIRGYFDDTLKSSSDAQGFGQHRDTDNLDLMGEQMSRLICYYQDLLNRPQSTWPESMPFRVEWAKLLWAKHHKAWNIETGGRNLNDFLFIALCHAHACAHIKQVEHDYEMLDGINWQEFSNEIGRMGADWGRGTVTTAQVALAFRTAVVLVVYVCCVPSRALELADIGFKLVNNPFAKTRTEELEEAAVGLGGQSRLTDAEREELNAEDNSHQREVELNSMVLALVAQCQRFFFHVWFHMDAFAQGKLILLLPTDTVTATSLKLSETRRTQAERALMDWFAGQFEFDPSAKEVQSFEDFCYMGLCRIGAVLHSRRKEGADNDAVVASSLFQAECSENEKKSVQQMLEEKTKDIFKRGAKHPFFREMLIHRFLYHVNNTFSNKRLGDAYLVRSNDFVQRWSEVMEIKNKNGAPKCPMMVEICGFYHVVYAHRAVRFTTPVQMIVYWMMVMRDGHRGIADTGHELEPAVISLFFGPPTQARRGHLGAGV